MEDTLPLVDADQQSFWQRPLVWRILGGLLVIPAIFSCLGYLPLDVDSDEPRRALVALEMMLSDDYITPTINGVPYLNKPPLYNWLIVGSFKLFKNYSSFALRFPMAISLVLYALTVNYFVRRHIARRRTTQVGSKRRHVNKPLAQAVAFAAAMMLVTNTRVLFYDSMLSLIDITFSWVTYTSMMLIYHFDRRKNYLMLYLSTYILMAAGFLLKGMPALAFQGLTLLVWFGYQRNWKGLFHWAHLLGIAAFCVLVGSYYNFYLNANRVEFSSIMGVLFQESAKRTPFAFGIGTTLLHLVTFPVEVLYQYLPWTLLAVLLIRPGLRQRLEEHDRFVLFNALVFVVNVLAYWVSPQVFARYLIMLLPPLFTVLSFLYYTQDENEQGLSGRLRVGLDGLFMLLALIVTIGCWTAVFHPLTRNLPSVLGKTAFIFVLLSGLTYQMLRQPTNRLAIFLVFMVVVRIGFNWFVLPPRVAKRAMYQQCAEQAARRSVGHPLYADPQTFSDDGATDANSFHIEAVRGEVLTINPDRLPTAYYIADSASLVGNPHTRIAPIVLCYDRPAAIVHYVK